MASGAVFDGLCYQSSQEAQDAYYSSAAPFSYVDQNGTPFTFQYEKRGPDWILLKYQDMAVVGKSYVSMIDGFSSCDPAESFNDGLSIGWAISLTIIIIASFKLMQRAAK